MSPILRLGPKLFTVRGQQQFTALPFSGACAAHRQDSLALLDSLGERVRAIEEELEKREQQVARVLELRTHPSVGLLTGVAVVHALEPFARFDRARRIAAYCGLGPKEHSSGDTQRFGHISKQGNRPLRFLLVEAAHAAIREEEDLRLFYFRLQSRRNSALPLVAVARKLVLRLHRMPREEIDYDEFWSRGRDARRARVAHSSVARRDYHEALRRLPKKE
jgi:transposase